MVIVLIEILFIYYIVKILKKSNINIVNTVLVALLLQGMILIIYRLDLASLGRTVYYSDAEIYWENTLRLLRGEKLIGTQVGYAYFCAAIQLVSPFRSVVWINISNILLIDLSVLVIDILFVKYELLPANVRTFTRICLYNPLIIYSLGRNLKDSLFLFIIVLIIYFYTLIKLNKKWIYIIPIILLTVTVATIRPWGFLIMPLLVMDGILSSEIGSLLKRIGLAVGIGVIFIVILKLSSLWDHVLMWEPIVMEHAGNLSVSELLIAPIKIITGPGPYRAFLGNQYFYFTTSSGNVFSGIGALMWWWMLSIYICNATHYRLSVNNNTMVFVLVFFLLIYSLQYGGSLELRFRGIIYILFSAVFFAGIKDRVRSVSVVNIIAFFIILLLGTLISV